MEKNYLAPAEIAEYVIEAGEKKAKLPVVKALVLGILAGAFIAFASEASNQAAHTISSIGLQKTLAGAIFATGLMFVLIAGGELFTGNSLMVVGLYEGRYKIRHMLKNWTTVYIGNFIGGFIVAYLIVNSGQLNWASDGVVLGEFTVNVAVKKVNYTVVQLLFMGILCNWVVCLAVWMCYAANDIAGKILACFFPIWLFITSGFEHSIANMYYLVAGLMAQSQGFETTLDTTAGHYDNALTIGSMFYNLTFVTIGNIIGGALFVGTAYWFVYIRRKA